MLLYAVAALMWVRGEARLGTSLDTPGRNVEQASSLFFCPLRCLVYRPQRVEHHDSPRLRLTHPFIPL